MHSVVGGRFAIERAAGSGGMARVFQARELTTGERVAIKMLHASDDAGIARFEREIAALRHLAHPAIVRYIAHGIEPATTEPFLALEWLDGVDLAQRLRSGPLSLVETLALGRAVAAALAEAHGRGIVHRDIKPGNLFLVDGDPARPKVLDFGLARDFADGLSELTRTGDLLGTPLYMAPEQARGDRDLDARVDVHALGCVLFACLVGQPPFVAPNLVGLMAKIAVEIAPSVRALRADVPDALDRLIATMLGKRREERPADANAIGDALAAIATGGDLPRAVQAGSISMREQRVVCVLLASSPTSAVDPRAAQTLDATYDSRGSAALRLADGTLLVTYTGPESPTDLATRAVRAALDMRAPELALALATGHAVVGQAAPVGAAIDRAARELEAAHGVLRVDAVTAGLVEGRFEMTPHGDGALVHSARGGLDQMYTLLGKPTRCVGRERELAAIEGYFAECVDDAAARVVVFTADAGIGKSRLAREVVRRLQLRDATVVLARAESANTGVPFALLADAIERAAGFTREDGPARRRDRLDALVGAAHAEVLAEIVGIPSRTPSELLVAVRENPTLMFEQLRRVVEAWLSALAAARPVVFVVEDLHWADPSSLTLFDALLPGLANRPFLLLGFSRPSPRLASLWSEHRPHFQPLDPLSTRASERLVRDALGDVSMVRSIVERAAGNALFLEELVRAAAGDRAGGIPVGIVGTLQLRFDQLAPDVRLALRAASVYGDHFDTAGVAAIVPGIAIDRAVAALVQTELVRPARHGFAFRHGLVRDAAYTLLADEDRALAHRLAAGFLETRDTSPAILATHFELGGDRESALIWTERAAEYALGLDDLAGARRHCEHAFALRGGPSGMTSFVLAEAAFWQGDLVASRDASHEAVALLDPSSTAWFAALGIAITATGQLGDNDEVIALLDRMLSRDPPDDARSLYVAALARAVKQLVWAEQIPHVHRALDRIAEVRGDHSLGLVTDALECTARAYLAYIELDPTKTFAELARASERYTRVGAIRDALQSDLMSAVFRLEQLCDVAGALPTFHAIQERAAAIGASYLHAWAEFEIGLAHVLGGRIAEGRARMNAIPEVIREPSVFRAGRLAGELFMFEPDTSDQPIRDVHAALVSRTLSPTYTCLAEAARAWLALRDGDREQARTIALATLAQLDTIGDGKLECRIAVVIAAETAMTVDPVAAAPLVQLHATRIRAAIERIADADLRATFAGVPWFRRLVALA